MSALATVIVATTSFNSSCTVTVQLPVPIVSILSASDLKGSFVGVKEILSCAVSLREVPSVYVLPVLFKKTSSSPLVVTPLKATSLENVGLLLPVRVLLALVCTSVYTPSNG